ncbi:MAG: transcriptional regulator [Verrucomicrobia bacterium]|nr:transcriptional regulator [Verrucomicrobiota bacterium]
MKASSVRDIAAVAKSRRRHLGLSQANLAAKTGVGREWVIEFEKGKASVELGYVVRVLRVLGLSIDLQPEVLPSGSDASDLETILGSTLKEAGRP